MRNLLNLLICKRSVIFFFEYHLFVKNTRERWGCSSFVHKKWLHIRAGRSISYQACLRNLPDSACSVRSSTLCAMAQPFLKHIGYNKSNEYFFHCVTDRSKPDGLFAGWGGSGRPCPLGTTAERRPSYRPAPQSHARGESAREILGPTTFGKGIVACIGRRSRSRRDIVQARNPIIHSPSSIGT